MSKHKTNKSRRDFIKKAALGAGGVSAAGLGFSFTKPIISELPDPEGVEIINTDVAVVGGGVSGVYAALRLANVDIAASPVSPKARQTPTISKQSPRRNSPIARFLASRAKPKLDVKLFEYSGRIGGRLISTPIQGIPAGDKTKSGPLQYAEFGGFRFDRQMKIVWETAQALGLTDEPFYYQDIKIEENNIVNVRGDLFTNAGTNSNSYTAYNISQKEITALNNYGDLGTYVENLAFQTALPDADINKSYPNIQKITARTDGTPGFKVVFKKPFIPGSTALPTVTIPPAPNGYSFSYARYHYAFNAKDWKTVKAVAGQYENAKATAKIGGRPFFDWSWWALKRYYLTQEAVAYLEDTSGYNEEGTAGTAETNIDEDYYFSVKSDTSDLTYYSVDPHSAPTAWRHIFEGYSAIPQQLFNKYKSINNDKSINVVKHQLIAFTKMPAKPGVNDEFPQYRCLFVRRQQGPDLAVSGAAALNLYQESLFILSIPTKGLPTDEANEIIAAQAEAKETLKQYKIVYCNFLILAMPRRSLELINQNNFFFGTQGVQRMLRESVDNIPAMRMFVAYPKPWWLNKPPYGNTNPAPRQSSYYPVGRTRTDLGLRQLYYWCYNKGQSVNGNFVDPDKPAVMLASYTSGDATLYWRAIQDGQPYDLLSGSLTPQGHLYNPPAAKMTTDNNIRNPQAGGPRHGSLVMGVEAHKQIVELHGMSDQYDTIPLPYYVHFEDWTKDPWGGGWHGWHSGYSKVKYIPLLRNPVPDENVFIIGECYSNVQGWVQGALNAAEAMLQCNLGLPWASWLSVDGIWLGQGTDWVTISATNPDPNPCVDEDGQFQGQ